MQYLLNTHSAGLCIGAFTRLAARGTALESMLLGSFTACSEGGKFWTCEPFSLYDTCLLQMYFSTVRAFFVRTTGVRVQECHWKRNGWQPQIRV